MDKKEFFSESKDRLDRFLTLKFKESRSQIENLIKNGFVKVNGDFEKKSGYALKVGDIIEVELPEPIKEDFQEVSFSPEKIYEDEDILVLQKPSGVVVHKASSYKGATLVDWLKQENISLSTISGEERHGIVHRLDKETSGVMVVAKNNQAHKNLSDQLQSRSMGRLYLALIDLPLKDDIIVEKSLGRNRKNRLKIGVLNSGRYAKSEFFKIEESSGVELILAKLYTGRTHQIRAHLESINRHILGDSLYGFKGLESKIKRVLLHAFILYLEHPTTKEMLFFKAEIPKDFLSFFEHYKFNMESIYEKINSHSTLRSFSSTS